MKSMARVVGYAVPVLAAVATLALILSCGCVGTLVTKKEDSRLFFVRLAILYPFDVGSARYSSTNGTFELGNYKTEGANSNTTAFASTVIEDVAEGVSKGVVKGLK